jgi:hypothetical protein
MVDSMVAMCALPAALGRVDGVCPASLGIGRGAVLRKLAALAARRGRNRQRLDASVERPCPLAASAVGAAIRKARSTDTERLIAALEGMEFETFRPGPCAQKRAALYPPAAALLGDASTAGPAQATCQRGLVRVAPSASKALFKAPLDILHRHVKKT